MSAQKWVAVLLMLVFALSLIAPIHSAPIERDSPQPKNKIDQRLFNATSKNAPVDTLVRYDSDISEYQIENAISLIDAYAEIPQTFQELNMMRVKLAGEALSDLAELDYIRKIWSNEILKLNPLNFTQSKSTEDYVSPVDLIGARDLWDMGYNGSGSVIAILDTGVDFTHPDLDDFDNYSGNALGSKVTAFASFVEADSLPFDLIGHGTYAASIVAGTGNKSNRVYSGIAPGATLLSGKVTLGGLFALPSWIVSGIEWAASRGADVILMPFNTFGAPGDAVSEAVKIAVQRGIFVVAAAGDDGPDYLTVMSPGGIAECFTVGAYDSKLDMVPDFSGRGPSLGLITKPDLVAPGVGIVGAKPGAALAESGFTGFDLQDLSGFSALLGGQLGESVDDYYVRGDTTAASAAIVAGAASLLMEAFDRATPIVIANTLRDTATPLDYGANDAGAGLLNLPAAFDELSRKQRPISTHNRTTGIPLLAFGLLTSSGLNAETTLLMSSFGTSIVALDERDNQEGSIHLLMGMFSIKWNDLEPMSLMNFNVKRELHQVALASQQSNYNRWVGVLSYDEQVYLTLLVESYNLTLFEETSTTAFKITPYILNLGMNPIYNVSLYLDYSLDLFLDGRDDYGRYALGNQQLFAYGISEDNRNFYFGMNSSMPLSAFEVGNSSEVSDHVSSDNLTGNTQFYGDVGLGMKWNFGTLDPNELSNVTISIGFGANRTTLDASIRRMWELEPPATFSQRGDLLVVEADIPRTAQTNQNYQSRAVIMNIGVESSQAVAILAIANGSQQEGTAFTRYFSFDEIEPFNARVITTEWSPVEEGIHTAAWAVATGFEFALQLVASPTETLSTSGVSLLDDFLLRDLFVISPIRSTSIFPKEVPFGPFDLRFPIDFGLYYFTLSTTVSLGNLTVEKYGNAADWGNITLPSSEDVDGFYNFSLFTLVPPITVDGYHRCDYVLNSEFGWSMNLTLESNLEYPRAMMLLDTSHGGGFGAFGNFGGGISVDIGGDSGGLPSFPLAQDTGQQDGEEGLDFQFGVGDIDSIGSLTDMLESFRLTTFSGLSSMKKQMADAGLNLIETPGIELESALLSQFSSIFMFQPSEGFNSTDVSTLRTFSASYGKLILFGDSDDRANLTGINQLLQPYGYRMQGKHESENTTGIYQNSILGKGMTCMWLGGGTFIENNQSRAQVGLNGRPVVLLDHTRPELALFGSSRIFMNKHLVKCNNSILLDNLIEYLLRDTLTTETSLSEDTNRFPVGKSVYVNLKVWDYYGDPVDDLTVAIAFELPNGNFSYFIAGFVEDGLYSSQFLPSYWSSNGTINGIFIVLREEYAGTYASVTFELYTTPPTNGTRNGEPLFTLVQVAFVTSIGIFGVVLVGLAWNKYRRGVRLRIPEIDTELGQDIDNTLNMLLAVFTQMEDVIQRDDLDRIQKIEALRSLMVSMEKAQEEYEDVSDRVGGV
ncbi:hypothetical protein EU537_05830 [Candidatus Thorarchaeota archaeon]|nr:MAG: hypothetical protein EU537_05830 [Candidatus Thorarchaeota archaeon]